MFQRQNKRSKNRRNQSDDKDVEQKEMRGRKKEKKEREFAKQTFFDGQRRGLIRPDRQIDAQKPADRKIGRKAGRQILYACRSVIQIDRFINNESRKTGKINSVNKCAVSSSAPVPNGLCLCTSLASVYIYMCVSVCVHSFKQCGGPRCHGNHFPEPHYCCCVMMMRDSFTLPHRNTHRHMCILMFACH